MWKHTIQSLALADGLPNLKGGLPPPADGLPLATNSDGSNLATTAAALVAFRIGPVHANIPQAQKILGDVEVYCLL